MVNKNTCIDIQRDNFNQLPHLNQWFCNGTQSYKSLYKKPLQLRDSLAIMS